MVDFNLYVDRTNLLMDAKEDDIRRLCDEALIDGNYAVCIRPYHVRFAVEQLSGTEVKVAAVIGFPQKKCLTIEDMLKEQKERFDERLIDIDQSLNDGAHEIDPIIHLPFVKHGEWDAVYEDILTMIEVKGTAPMKLIQENCYLDFREKMHCYVISELAGVDFIKTSTGMGIEGAVEEDILLMAQIISPDIGIKMAGGVTAEKAPAFYRASQRYGERPFRFGASKFGN